MCSPVKMILRSLECVGGFVFQKIPSQLTLHLHRILLTTVEVAMAERLLYRLCMCDVEEVTILLLYIQHVVPKC